MYKDYLLIVYDITLSDRLSTRNFNVPMAKASKVTIAEVEEIVETGEIDPDQIHVPGMYVDRVIKGSNYEKALSVCAYSAWT